MSKSKHLAKAAGLGCIACYLDGNAGTPAEIHHIREGQGMAMRASDDEAIPLCPAHHRGTMHPAVPSIHLGRKAFIERYGTEADLLAKVRELI